MAKAQKYFLIVVACILLFSIRYYFFVRDHGDPLLEEMMYEKVEVIGIVITEPEERDTGTRGVIKLTHIKIENRETELKPTNIVATFNAYSGLHYGDMVTIAGVLTKPEIIHTEGERDFNYPAYLAKDKIFYEMRYPTLSIISSHHGNKIKEILYTLKNTFVSTLDMLIPFPESGLASGIVVAGKRALPKDTQEEFRVAGALQVVVLSGYNVTIIAETLMLAVSFLPPAIGFSLGSVGIILFTIMAGGSATIVRASIMALLAILAKVVRRTYDPGRILMIAGFIMLIHNPMLLMYDPSFQLSFVATSALIYGSPYLKKYFIRVPEKYHIREIVTNTVSAQIFVMPYIMYLTGDISLVAFPVNLTLSFLIPVTMFLCFVTGIVGLIVGFIAAPVAYVAFFLLWLELKIVHISTLIPFASIKIPQVPLWSVVFLYVLLVWFISKPSRSSPRLLPS